MLWRYKEQRLFQENLKEGVDYFKDRKVIPPVIVDKKGLYTYIDCERMED